MRAAVQGMVCLSQLIVPTEVEGTYRLWQQTAPLSPFYFGRVLLEKVKIDLSSTLEFFAV